MPVKLAAEDRNKVIEILARLPEFQSERDRIPLVRESVASTERGDLLMTLVELNGPPQTAARNVIARFADYGDLGDGHEALESLLTHIRPVVSPNHWSFLDDFFHRHGWTANAPTPDYPGGGWRDGRDYSEVKEAIIGENTLRHTNFLEKGLLAARAVVRIHVRSKGWGTGFMVSPTLLFTNHHVIGAKDDAKNADFGFFHELDAAGNTRTEVRSELATNGFLHADEALDYALIRLAGPPAFGRPLRLAGRRVARDERVNIIQHPGGDFKRISIQNNFVAYADDAVLQYYTSTEQGSSGSPILDDDFVVVGIHHSGGMLKEPDTLRHFYRNGGTTIGAVLRSLQADAPGAHRELMAAQEGIAR